jgi:protein-S-isoprenylcysteine O-methyltransferase
MEVVSDQGPSTTTINTAYCSTLNVFPSLFTNMASDTHRGLNGLATDVQQLKANALETNPLSNVPRGNIPNTPLASSTISFLLGCSFLFGVYTAVNDIPSTARLLTYQLGCFIAAWAFFHWAEFAVTAGWNFEKCSVDCQSFPSREEEKN